MKPLQLVVRFGGAFLLGFGWSLVVDRIFGEDQPQNPGPEQPDTDSDVEPQGHPEHTVHDWEGRT